MYPAQRAAHLANTPARQVAATAGSTTTRGNSIAITNAGPALTSRAQPPRGTRTRPIRPDRLTAPTSHPSTFTR
jgi:hypothetical protein